MPDDLTINTPDISIYDLGGVDAGSSVRLYGDTREDHLCLQIRKRNPITPGGKARKRNMLAHAVLSSEEVLVLREALTQFLGGGLLPGPVGDISNAGAEVSSFKFEIRTDNAQQAYDMARLMLVIGNLYGSRCCVDGIVAHGPWPALPGDKLSPEAQGVSVALRALFGQG